MFTGLIQASGKIQLLGEDRIKISISSANTATIIADLEIGDSVAVDGVCLTVEEILEQGFIATASPETLQRTSLGQRSQSGTDVNLETSLRVGSKLGGHFVTGHVDGVGCFLEAIPTQQAWEIRFGVPTSRFESELWYQAIAPYLAPKGSIAVNGISLTIVTCNPQSSWFSVAVIPHTYENTSLSYLEPGVWVNLESDILGKYVNRLLDYKSSGDHEYKSEEISLNFLAEHGYYS